MSIAEKLTTIAANEQRVFEAGKTAEYDRFWDSYQENGTRRNYKQAFYDRGWTDDSYRPKYPIIAEGEFNSAYRESKMTSLSNIDTSGATNLNTAFYGTKLKVIEKVDLSSATTLTNTFAHSYNLHTIVEIVSSENTVWSDNSFNNCYNLVTVMFTKESIIATNFNCTSNKLTHDSLMSIINALKDFSTEGGTHTCTIGSANLKKLTDTEKAIATQKGWTLS